MSDIKKGDVVILKSGGPKMTVQDLGEYTGTKEGAYCVWFEGSKQQGHVFDVAVLKKVE